MVMVFVRKMANFVYLPQHGIQPTCSFTAATTQIMATERTQKKTISYNLYNIRLLEAFFFFMLVKVSIEFNIWGKFLPIWFCPFCFERLSKYCERSKVLWTIKWQKNGWWVCSKKILDSWFSYFCHGLYVAIQSCTPVESGNGLQAYKHSWHISLKA